MIDEDITEEYVSNKNELETLRDIIRVIRNELMVANRRFLDEEPFSAAILIHDLFREVDQLNDLIMNRCSKEKAAELQKRNVNAISILDKETI